MSSEYYYLGNSNDNYYYTYGNHTYVLDETQYEEVSESSDPAAVLDDYISSGEITTASEDELQELDEEVSDTESSDETSYPEGYDYESSTAYNESIGLSALTEDSGIDEYIAVFEQIEEQVNELDRKIASVDEDDPEALEELFADMTNMTVAIADLASATDTELPSKGVVGKVVTASTAGIIGGGIAIYGVVNTAGKAALLATTWGVGSVVTTLGTALSIVSGVGIAVAVVAGIWAGVSAYQNYQAQKQLEQLQEDIQATAETLNGAWDDASEKLQDGASAAIDEVEEDLDGLLEDEFSFDDVTDVDSILDNIDKIIDAQAKLEPFYTVASTYGIEIEGLDELMEKLGTGDDSLQYAQSYLDAYADQVSLDITDEVITDTETLNALYEDIELLIEDASDRGLDTSKLEDLLETITETNQEEADETADDIADSGTSSSTSSGTSSSGTSSSGTSSSSGDDTVSTVTTATEASEEASTTADEVESASTSYDTDTSSLDETSEELIEYAQTTIDNYVASISTDGLTIEELEALYDEVNAVYTQLSGIEGVDYSGITSKLTEIRTAQQTIIDELVSEYTSSVSSATTSSERLELLTAINGYISQYSSYSVDISGLSALVTQITETEQTEIDTYIASISTDGLSVEELETLYNTISAFYTEHSGFEGVDYSGITSKLTEISEAQQTIINELASNYSAAVSSASTTSEMIEILSEINTYISQYSSYSVDISVLSSLAQEIITAEQNNISEKAATYITECNSCTTKEEISAVTLNVQTDIQYAQSMGLDVSAYKEVLTLLYQKLEEIQYNESNTEIDNSVTDNSTTDNSVTVTDDSTTDNSITVTDNSTTDNSITDNSTNDNSVSVNTEIDNSVTDNSTTDNSVTVTDDSTTDNSITDNSVTDVDNSTTITNDVEISQNTDNSVTYTDNSVTSIDNSVTNNIEINQSSDVDTSTIEELLQKILDKLNEEKEEDEETVEETEEEETVTETDDIEEETEIEDEETCEDEDNVIPDTDNLNVDIAVESDSEEETAAESETVAAVETMSFEIEETAYDIEEEAAAAETVEEIDDEEEIEETVEETEEETAEESCEEEDEVAVESSDSETTVIYSSDGDTRTTAQINAGVEIVYVEPEAEETTDTAETQETEEADAATETDTETQETAETSSSIIIEGEDGYDYELDFEEDE